MAHDIRDIAKSRLVNQMLVGQKLDSPKEVVDWMGAVQAQDYKMFLWAIGIRMRKPDRQSIVDAVNRGEIVRLHLNRATWQVVAAEDAGWMTQLYKDRNKKIAFNYYRNSIDDKLLCRCYDAFLEMLDGGKSLNREELMQGFKERGIECDKDFLMHLLRIAEAEGLICGGNIEGRIHTYALLENRIPKQTEVSKEEALMLLARKYFRSHAPATLVDYRWWSGLTAGECNLGISLLDNELDSFVVGGEEYYIHKDNPTGRMNNSSVLFLPPYDEILLGYKNRTAVLAAQHARFAHNNSGIFYPVILHKGRIVGNWNMAKKLTYSFFDNDSAPDDFAAEKGAAQLLEFWR